MNSKKVIEIINESELFRDSKIDLERVIIKNYKRGLFIRDEVDKEPSVAIILEGSIDVYSVSYDGSEINVTTLHSKDVFGISNIFSKSELKTILKCKTNASIAFIPKYYLLDIITNNRAVMETYCKLCNEKIQFLLNKIEFLSIKTCSNKLIEYILSNINENSMISLQCSKEQFAKQLGISRASLFREISTLQNLGIIKTDGTNIEVCNIEKLSEKLLLN